MLRAVELARRGWGRVAPNPMVGAVVVRGAEAVGEGWHAEFGGPHAEVEALRAAGGAARGATLYVTLEPCVHQGKTPPCVPAIVEAGIERVVIGCRDPDPVAGGGARMLRAVGLEVRTGVEGTTCARLDAPYLWRCSHRLPFVALKLALSLDAALTERPAVLPRITGREADAWVQELRAGFDAILVGRGTVSVDDPRLTVRGGVEPRRPPVRIVVDTALEIAPGARVLADVARAPTWLACGPDAPAGRRERLEAAGARVLEVEGSGEGVDMGGLLRVLSAEGVGRVLCEGGARVARSLLDGGYVQGLHLLYAPTLYGAGAPGAFGGARVELDGWEVTARAALGRDTLLSLESERLGRIVRAFGEA